MKKNHKLIIISGLFFNSCLFGNSYAYNGTSGLLEIPNARIQKDFSGTIFYSNDNPYSHYGLSFAVLPQVEINAHLTNVRDSKIREDEDKVLNLKLLLFPETTYTPSFVYGMDDFWGDLNYASKYFAISKKIGYFDFSLGYGIGRLGANNYKDHDESSYKYLKKASFKNGKIFGGAEFYASKNLRILLEHSSIDYKQDKKNSLKKKPKTSVNFGINYDFTSNISSKVSLQRGNTVSFSLAYKFSLLKNERKTISENSKKYEDSLANNLIKNNFSNISMLENEDSLWISAQNDSSYYDIDSLLKATNSVVNSKNTKTKYDYVYLDLNKRNKKVLKINTKEFKHYKNKDVSNTYMKEAVFIENKKENFYEEFLKSKKINKLGNLNKQSFYYDIQPYVKNYLRNKRTPIYNKTQLNLNGKYLLTNDLDLNATLSFPIYSTMRDLEESTIYDKYNKPYLDKFNISYYKNFLDEHYLNIDIGLLNQKYMGTNVEYQKSFFEDKFALSLQYQNAKRRYDNKIFKTIDKNYDAKFLNLYYQLSKEKNTHLGLKLGEFLNDDKGYRLDFARSYKKFIFGAYFSRTKKDKEKFNTKGFYVKIPLSKKYFNNAKRTAPITFDSLANDYNVDFVEFDNSLFNKLSNENNLQIIKKNINFLKK